MPSGKNYNIQTKRVRPATGASATSFKSIGGAVPTGMKRYVTFVQVSRVEGATGKGVRVYIASTAASATLTLTSASASSKMKILIGSASCDGNFSIPAKINTKNPLFSVAEGKYLTVRQGSTAALGNAEASIFVQYYDQ